MANSNPFEKLFRLNSIKPGKISEISEATSASSVPPQEKVNFHIGNPVQSEILAQYYLQMILNLQLDNVSDEEMNFDAMLREINWDGHELPRLKFLYSLIKNSAPYSPRGGYSITKPIDLIRKFHQWLEKDQEEPLSYDLGEKSGRREIIISSGGIDEALRILFHTLNSFLVNTPANIFFLNKEIPLFAKNFDALVFYKLPNLEKSAFNSLSKILNENSDKPNFLVLGNLMSEDMRRNLRKLAFNFPLSFIEINDAPNHHSLAREAKLKSLVLRFLTPYFISNRLKNTSIVFLAGDSSLLKIYESVHFQLKGTPSASEIELNQYLLENNYEIQNERENAAVVSRINFEADPPPAFTVNIIKDSNVKVKKISNILLDRTDKFTSRYEKFFLADRLSNFQNLFAPDYFGNKTAEDVLNDLFENIDNEKWYELAVKSLISVFAKEHPEYRVNNLELINGSARTALGILGFHCGIEEIITCDYSWTYEHCFPKSVFIPLKDDFELDAEGICLITNKELQKNHARKIAVVINNPHNASGKIFNEAAVKKIIAYCLEKNIFIIDDLAYQNVLPENSISGPKTVKQLALELVNDGKIYREQLNKVISIHSLSKTDSFAGARIAFAEISDEELKKSFHYFNSLIKPNIAAVVLAYLFYRNDSERIKVFWLLRNKIFAAKMEAIESAVVELPESRNPFGIKVERPQGSMYPRMTINHLPNGLSLDWLSAGLAAQGIGLIPLSAFARTAKGFERTRKSFRLTLGGSDSADVLLRKTRRVLIDLNRLIAEEQAKYNKHNFSVKTIKRKNTQYLDNSFQLWNQLASDIVYYCRKITSSRIKKFTDENEITSISDRFFKKYLPSRLNTFSTIFKSQQNLHLDFLSKLNSEGNSALEHRLEQEFYKDNLERRQSAFKKRTFDRTVHPTQIYAIDTEILFNSAFEKIFKNQKPDVSLVTSLSKCLLDEYLGKNVHLNSAKEGEELVCDLKAVIISEIFSSIYSDENDCELLSFWGDWDGSTRPSGQGHTLVAAVLIENVNQLSNIIKTLIKTDKNISIDSNLLFEIELLHKTNNEFWELLNHITALTHQLEKRYKSILPFNIEPNWVRKLGMKFHIAEDPLIKLWQHNDRLEQKMISLRIERSKKLEYYFKLNKNLRKTLYKLIPAILKNSSNQELMIQAGFYRDLLKRFILTPRIHQKMITAKDQFAINTTLHNIFEINQLSGNYGNPGIVLGLQVSMSTNPDALISLDKKFTSERERLLNKDGIQLPKIWSIPLFEDIETVKDIDKYLLRIWEFAVQSRSVDQEIKTRFSEILCEIFIAGSDLSQQVGQTAAASLYKTAKFKTIEWLAKRGLTSDIRIKLGCGEPMQRQGGYYAEFSNKPAFISTETTKNLLLSYLTEATVKSTEFAISPLHGVFAGGDLKTLQSSIAEKIRQLIPIDRSQLFYHLRKTQEFYHSELVRASEPFIETRLVFESKSLKELERLTLDKSDEIFSDFIDLTTKNFRQIIYGNDDDVVGIHIISYFLSRAMPILRDRPVERPSRSISSNQGQKILERIASTIPLCKHGSLLRAISHNKAQTFVLGINQLTTGLFRALNQFSQKEFIGGSGYQLLNDRILPRLPVYEILHTLRILQDCNLLTVSKFSDAFPPGLTAFSLLREDMDSLPIFIPMLQKELLRRHGINVSEFFKDDKFIPELLPTVRPDLAVLLQPDLFNTNVETLLSKFHKDINQNWINDFSALLIIPEKIKYWREKVLGLLEKPVQEQVKSFVELAIALNTLSKQTDHRDFSSAIISSKQSKVQSSIAYLFRGSVDDSMKDFLSAAVQYLTQLPSQMVEVPIDIVRALNEVERILRIEEQALTKSKQDLLNFYLLQIAHHVGDNG